MGDERRAAHSYLRRYISFLEFRLLSPSLSGEFDAHSVAGFQTPSFLRYTNTTYYLILLVLCNHYYVDCFSMTKITTFSNTTTRRSVTFMSSTAWHPEAVNPRNYQVASLAFLEECGVNPVHVFRFVR